MILTHESGSQEDQFDEKKLRPKISWYYAFKTANYTVLLKVNPPIVSWYDDWFELGIIEHSGHHIPQYTDEPSHPTIYQ